MKKILRKILYILIVITAPHLNASKMLFMGNIQFPSILESIPDIRIYCGGNKIKCESQNEGKRISFGIQDDRQRTVFHILVTNKIRFESTENTVKYLKPSAKYTFYRLQLMQKEPVNSDPQSLYTWQIDEIRLEKSGRIPDDTIIVYYDPLYVDCIKGGNAIELPTIYIKPNILDLVGSETKLHDVSNELLLSAIDAEMIHSRIKQETRADYQQKTILAVTV